MAGSGGDGGLTGPDLERGIDAGDLADGAMLVGHARGEAVLLARRGRDVFAIGATCTHYGGPLVEGRLSGETVRCPWHHACFSLRTGAPERAPALTPVACFDVEERDGRLFVLGPKAQVSRTSPRGAPGAIVIVGTGAAGSSAALTLRREGYDGKVTVIGEESELPYDRPNLSKDYLAGKARESRATSSRGSLRAPEESISLRPREAYAEQDIQLYLDARAERIDVAARSLVLADGRAVPFGALLLATGADPVRPSLPGADLPHVFTLRSLADSRAIIAHAAGAKRAVVVGAGFIGLEVAAALRARGLEVAVVAPDAVPLERIMGPELGEAIEALHTARGVRFHLGLKVASIEVGAVVLGSGTRLAADLVVLGVGVVPSTELAARSGLTVDRGVVVDVHLATSRPGIYAAGDIARWPDARSGESIRVEHWAVAQRQGQTAALNMLGRKVRFDAVPFFWSAHYDVNIAYVGHAGRGWDRVDVVGRPAEHDCAVAFRRGGRTLAVATMGRDSVSLEAEAAMEEDDEARLRALVPPRSS